MSNRLGSGEAAGADDTYQDTNEDDETNIG